MSDLPEFRVVPIEEFAAVEEPGAEPLASTSAGGVLIPSAGIVLVYGSGGAGKTTLTLDLCFALAAGEPWLDLVHAERALRIVIIENEGPRPEFRRKLRAKLAASGKHTGGRIDVVEEPWAGLSLADQDHRRALAVVLAERGTDLVVFGPLVSAGEFPNGGTPDEIRGFEEHLADLRQLVGRPFAILLVHHENRVGQVSGAWERLPDTLAHVTSQGNRRTRIFWQKVRWASTLHGTSSHLVWADGESYYAERKPEVTEDTMTDSLLAAIHDHGGSSWTKIRDLRDSDGEKLVRGNLQQLERIRDRLLSDGALVNTAAQDGRFQLWVADDPACPRSGARTDLERITFPPPVCEDEPIRSPVPYVSRNGVGNGTDRSEPETIANELEWR